LVGVWVLDAGVVMFGWVVFGNFLTGKKAEEISGGLPVDIGVVVG